MSIRPQPYRFKWPWSASQVEGVDESFQILFKAVRTLEKLVASVTAAVGATVTTVVLSGTGTPGRAGRDGEDMRSRPPGINQLQSNSLLFVNPANSRVGIGTTAPTQTLQVVGTGDIVTITNTDTTGYLAFGLEAGSGNVVGRFYGFGSAYATSGRLLANSCLIESTTTAGLGLSTGAAGPIRLYTATVLRATISDVGGFSIGDATDPGAGNLRVAGSITEDKSGIAATSTDGVIVQNATASTAGVPVQQSPRIRLRSHVWNTTATAADNTDDWIIEAVPVSGLVPTGLFKIGKSINGAAYTYPLTISSGGTLTMAGQVTAGTNIAWADTGFLSTPTRTAIGTPAAAQINLLSQAVANTGVGLDFATDGTLKVRTRAQTGDAQLSAASVRGNAVTFANRPGTAVEGMLCAFTDSTTVVWGAPIIGAGANHVLGYYNGTNWTVAAI